MSSVPSTDGGYSYYNQSLGDLEDNLKDEAKRTRENQEQQTARLEEGYRKALEKRDRESEDTADRIRQRSAERIQAERERARSDVERARTKMYDRYGKSNEEIAFHQKRADQAIQQMRDEYDDKEKQFDAAMLAAADKRGREQNREVQRVSENDRRSRDRETANLRKTIHSLLDAEHAYMKERGQGTADARREVENEYLTQTRVMQDGYGQQIHKLKDKMAEMDRYYSDLNDQNHRDQNRFFTGVIQRMDKDQGQRVKELQTGYSAALVDEKRRDQKHRDAADRALERQSSTMNEERENAMRDQARAYQEMLARQKAQDQEQVDRLSKSLDLRNSSEDERYISPAAEAKIERGFTQEYEKKHQAEVQRDMSRADHVHDSYAGRLRDLTSENEDRLATAHRQYTSQQQLERAELLAHIQDIEQQKELTLDSKEHENERMEDSLNHSYTGMLQRQSRDYDNLLQQTKADASDKLAAAHMDAEFQLKMARRDFATQQNQLIRAYEKKLSDQKNAYEDQAGTLKAQVAQATRDGERRTKRLLTEQAKGYEQKIAQIQYQSKERERTISENYEDQLEKIKRANALLIQKKS